MSSESTVTPPPSPKKTSSSSSRTASIVSNNVHVSTLNKTLDESYTNNAMGNNPHPHQENINARSSHHPRAYYVNHDHDSLETNQAVPHVNVVSPTTSHHNPQMNTPPRRSSPVVTEHNTMYTQTQKQLEEEYPQNLTAGAYKSAEAAGASVASVASVAFSSTTNKNSRIHPQSNLSPRISVPHKYIIERTQSSPCVLDSSPKVSEYSSSSSSKPISQLTPITRNSEKFTHGTNHYNGAISQILSVPEEKVFTKKSLMMQNNPNSSNNGCSGSGTIIRPRSTTIATTTNCNEEIQNSIRPISPPTRMSLRPAPITTLTTTTLNTNEYNLESPQDCQVSSQLDTGVKLDRIHHSVPILSTTYNTTSNNTRATTKPFLLAQQSSPESFGTGTPEPRSPDSAESSSSPSATVTSSTSQQEHLLFIPYQPSRNSSLASFGIVPENNTDLDDIFLPLRRPMTNKFKRSSKDKVVLVNGGRGGYGSIGGCGVASSSIARPSSTTLNEDDDEFTHISETHSIPSIKLGARIQSSTQDSVTTYSYEGMEDDYDEEEELHHYSNSQTFDEDDYDNNIIGGGGGYLNSHGMQFQSHQSTPQQDTHRRKKNNRKSKYLSSKKEEQVYDWIRTLQVDRDNNEYVAEAASSKFLTGKMQMYHQQQQQQTGYGRGVSVGVENIQQNIQQLVVDQSDSMELKSGSSKDSTNTNTTKVTTSATNNKIVMGRNICAFTGGNTKNSGKSKPSTVKVSGLYR